MKSYLCSGLLFLYIIFQMTVFDVIGGHLTLEFHLSALRIGDISSLFFYCAALSLIPYGLLLDYYPMRYLTLVVVFVCVFASGIFVMVPSLASAALYRICCGLTNPLVFLVCMRQAPIWFPKKISLAISVLITIGMLGGLLQYPFSVMISYFGWKISLYVNFIFGLICFGLAYMFLADCKKEIPSNKNLKRHLYSVLTVRNNWLCGFYTAFLNWPVMVLGAMWGSEYLVLNHGISRNNASLVVSMIFLGMIPASPFFGWFAEFCRSYKRAMCLGTLSSIFVLLIIIITKINTIWILMLLFFLLGFTCTSQIISYTVINSSNSSQSISTAMSLVSIVIYFIGGLGNILYGSVVSFFLKEQQNAVFSSNMGMIMITVGFCLSLLFSLAIKNRLKET